VQPVAPPSAVAASTAPGAQRVVLPLDGFISPSLYPNAHPSWRLLKLKGRISSGAGQQAVLCNGKVVTEGSSVTVSLDQQSWTWRLDSIGARFAEWSLQTGGDVEEAISL
jgi:hypothetical protein